MASIALRRKAIEGVHGGMTSVNKGLYLRNHYTRNLPKSAVKTLHRKSHLTSKQGPEELQQ